MIWVGLCWVRGARICVWIICYKYNRGVWGIGIMDGSKLSVGIRAVGLLVYLFRLRINKNFNY